MGIITGQNGKIYFNAAITDTALASSLVFSTGKTITSSTDNGATGIIDFESEGYEEDMLVTISGCATSTENSRIFTISAVSSGALTVDEAVIAANPDTGTPVFTEREPGIAVGGGFNWTLNVVGDAHQTTNFDNSSGGHSFIGGLTSWSGTFDKHWLTSSNRVSHYRSASSTGGSWMGSTGIKVRLFTKYVATPSTGSPSQYFSGNVTITGIDHNTPVDALIDQSISFQGQSLLTLNTKTAAWNTTG